MDAFQFAVSLLRLALRRLIARTLAMSRATRFERRNACSGRSHCLHKVWQHTAGHVCAQTSDNDALHNHKLLGCIAQGASRPATDRGPRAVRSTLVLRRSPCLAPIAC